MASKIYRTYTADDNGYIALIADITAATAWSKVDNGDTSTTFHTSTGGRLIVAFTGSAINVMCLRAGDGHTVFSKSSVIQACFIKTAKASAVFFADSTAGHFLTNGIASAGVAISKGTNMYTGECCDDLMTALTTDNRYSSQIVNVDDTFKTSELGEYEIGTVSGTDVTIAIGACSFRSAYVSDDVLTCICTPLNNYQECDVTISGKKYYQARYFLFADE